MRNLCDERWQGKADRQEQEENRRQEQFENELQEQIVQQQLETQRNFEKQRDAENQAIIEEKYHLKYCHDRNFFNLAFMSNVAPEKNCLYTLGAAPLKVLQVEQGGILVVPTISGPFHSDKVIFIKTSNSYVDGDLVQHMFLKYDGVFSYINTIGAKKTIHSFKDLNTAR